MDLSEIKRILGKEGGKIVIVEQEKPVMVILSYEDFRDQNQRQSSSLEPFEEEPGVPDEQEELTIDDLPV
tara:strand:+ start:2928 stop:3137 length:210 start_codon:yes stop_codon:yes gene_type:complete